MPDTIDVRGLDERDVTLIEALVRRFRQKTIVTTKEGAGEDIVFASWPLGVKGKLTRKEIYDYL